MTIITSTFDQGITHATLCFSTVPTKKLFPLQVACKSKRPWKPTKQRTFAHAGQKFNDEKPDAFDLVDLKTTWGAHVFLMLLTLLPGC